MKLDDAQLYSFGVKIAVKRQRILKAVEPKPVDGSQLSGQALDSASRIVKRLHQSHNLQQLRDKDLTAEERKRERRYGKIDKKKRITDYSLKERIEMVRMVFVEKEKHEDVAKTYGLRTTSILNLVRKVRKKKNYMRLLIESEQEDLRDTISIIDAVKGATKKGQPLVSATSIIWNVKEDANKDVTVRKVHEVLKKDLQMSYVKIKDQAVNINSTKNILLRQEWARQFLSPSLENKHWLNIDESWLNMMDFRRRAWTPKHASSSLSKRIANPRISLTLCISSRGRVYYSLSQANNNSQTISLFMRELC